MAHKYSMRKLYSEPRTGEGHKKNPVRRLRSVTIVHTGRSGRRVLGVETSLKRAQALIDVDRGEHYARHANRHPNDRAFFEKHGVQ